MRSDISGVQWVALPTEDYQEWYAKAVAHALLELCPMEAIGEIIENIADCLEFYLTPPALGKGTVSLTESVPVMDGGTSVRPVVVVEGDTT